MNIFDKDIENFNKWLENFLYELEHREIKKDYDISKNVHPEICSKCGGLCCKRCGCHYSPDDFEEITFDFLKREIEKGYISIDYIPEEMALQSTGIYILRVRNQGAPIIDTGLERTPCILLTETGCKLDYEHRPSGGKLLIPAPNQKCYSNYSIDDCCHEWRHYQKILNDLVKFFENKQIPCSL